jgi:hypothetical protein
LKRKDENEGEEEEYNSQQERKREKEKGEVWGGYSYIGLRSEGEIPRLVGPGERCDGPRRGIT